MARLKTLGNWTSQEFLIAQLAPFLHLGQIYHEKIDSFNLGQIYHDYADRL